MELLSLEPLVWLTLIVALAVGLRYSLVDHPFWRQALAVGCRAIAIALLVLGLCRPYWLSPGEDLHVVMLVDMSDSVDLDAIAGAAAQVEETVQALAPSDSWSLFAVGAEVRPLDSPDEIRATVDKWREGIGDDRFRGQTRLADALLETRLAFPAGASRRVVLWSDGRETGGELDAALEQLAEEETDVRLARLEPLQHAEASVARLEPTTPNAFQGEVVRMRAYVTSNRDMPAQVRIIHNGVAEATKRVKLLGDEPNRVEFDIEMRSAGPSRYQAEVVPQDDYFPLNNSAGATVNVSGQPRVLVLHQEPREMRPFSRAMQEQGVELDVRGRLGLPNSLEQLLAFDAVMLADLPATDVSARQMNMLKRYVVDCGGGLMMLGSENSFGLGGYFKTPVEEVLPLVSRFEKEKEKPSLAMVLVIDKSGSMNGAPIALARQAAKAAAELLSHRDQIGVVAFDGSPYLVSELRSAGDINAIHASIDSLQAGGGTFMYPAMVQARDMLEIASAKIRHMIVLSDGRTQPADHQSLVQEAADAGITVSTVALGGADKQLLASLAELGKGRYYETDDPSNVPQIFTKETMQASKSAIKEDLYGAVQTADHPVLAGFNDSDLPFTLGYVMTEAKPTAQLLLAAETGDPLLATGRYGLGAGMAYTSDLTERWGGEWLAWDNCGKFWSQVLRGLLRKSDAEGLSVASHVRGEHWRIELRRHDQRGAPLPNIHWEAAATNQYGRQTDIEVREVGLGRYAADVPLDGADRLSVRVHDRDFDKLKVLHWRRPYPAEYSLASEPPSAISRLPEFQPAAVRDDLVPQPKRTSVSHVALLAALAFLLAGLVLRRA